MAIFMVRHGQTNWNVARKTQGKTDIELNETGLEQAKIVSQKLKDEQIDLIICSPLKRAKKTAQIINEELHCPIIYEEGISERAFGEFEGTTVNPNDMEKMWDYQKNSKYCEIEPMKDFFERVYQTLDNAIEKYPEKNVLLVAHGGVSVPVYCYFNGIPKDRSLTELFLENCEVAKYNYNSNFNPKSPITTKIK